MAFFSHYLLQPLPVRVVPIAIIPVPMSRQARRCMEAAAAIQPSSPLLLPTSSPVRPLTVTKRLLSNTAITASGQACSPSDIAKVEILTPQPLLAQSSPIVLSGSSDPSNSINTVKKSRDEQCQYSLFRSVASI